MKVTIKRIADNGDTTMGALYINNIFKCFTVEDEERSIKVKGETRIPEGTYKIGLRKEGGYHNKYSSKYGSMHKGMLCIYNSDDWKIKTDTMEFQYILIHTGNTDEHTMGCLLVNYGLNGKTFVGNSSVDSYKDIYPIIANAIESGEEVNITYEKIY